MGVAKKATLFVLALLAAGSVAFASSEGGSTRFEFFDLGSSTPPDTGYRLHANLGAGFGTVTGGDYQSSPSGEYYLGTVGMGRRTRHWEWDTDLGWGYSRRTGTDQYGNPVAITIRSARADWSIRYRILPRWQLGPVVALTFGTDTHFTPTLGDPAGTIYGGLRTTIDLSHVGKVPVEAWGEALTELTKFGRDAFTVIVGIRMSLPIIHKIDQIVITHAEPRRDVRVVLDANRVFFRTDSDKLRPEFVAALDDLAEYLAKTPDHWDSIEIAGHTDKRGTLKYNMKLSQRRAASVEQEFIKRGLATSRIQVEAFGPTRPLDKATTRIAYAKNRRVELVFKNVSDADPLMQKLAPLKGEPTLDPSRRKP